MAPLRWIAAAILLLQASCTSPNDEDDGGRDDARRPDAEWGAAGDGDRSETAEAATDAGARRGPLTNAGATIAATTERLCDLDGDGVEDNAIAELGPPHADLLASVVSTGMQGTVETGQKRIFHFPWIDDLSGPNDPEAILIFFAGEDTEEPDDLSDDLSGEEEYYIAAHHLDGCGEPRTAFTDVTIEDGALSGSTDALPLIEGLSVTRARARGTVAPGGASMDVWVCGAGEIGQLGAEADIPWLGGWSLLEGLLAGGMIFSIPTVPGLSPDLDLDGDGLERLEVDDEGRITACIDGDHTVIEGADCWQDERMADGFSFNLHLTTVSAVFAGRQPGWETMVSESCEGGPPETSLFEQR